MIGGGTNCPVRWLNDDDKTGEDNDMGKGLLLWLIGIPIPVILILFLIFR